MSIIEKISKTYIFLTIGTIISFVIIILFYTDIYDKSEISRIKGITSGEIRSFNDKISNLKQKGDVFLDWISKAEQISHMHGIENIIESFDLRGKIQTSDYDCVGILNNKDQVISDKKHIALLDHEYKYIIQTLKEDNFKEQGFITINNKLYYVYLKRIAVICDNDLRLLLAKEIDTEFVNSNTAIDRSISIEKNINKNNMDEIELIENKKIYLHMEKTKVKSYVPIKIEGLDNEFYLCVSENKKSESFLMAYSINIIGMFIIAFSVGNYIIYRIIKEKLMCRIINTNNKVNSIIKNNYLHLLNIDTYDDEITNLSKDINKLVLNLKEDNKKILIKERNNSRLLESMQNLYIYIELIQDSNGQVIDGIIKEMNNSAIKFFEISEAEIGKSLSYFKTMSKYKYYNENTFIILNNIKEKGKSINYKNCKIDENLYFDINININHNDNTGVSIILNDVSDINLANIKLNDIVTYDDITKLFTKFYMIEHLNKLTKMNVEVYTILLDLDDFKSINDAIGHVKGDKILKILGEGLSKLNSDEISVGRFGGDEFIIVGIGNKDVAQNTCNNIRTVINRRLKFNNYTYEVKCTLGISLYPSQALNSEQLIQYADIAMHTGKLKGKDMYKVYSKEMMERYQLQGRLKEAIGRGEIEAYYQPIFDMLSNKIIGAEALARWVTIKEVITPDKFLKAAKKNGDIVMIDDFILRQACKLCKEKIEEGRREFYVSVNISYKYFMLDSFIDTIKEVIRDSGINSSGLRLEITEKELLSDYDNLNKKLWELRKLGIKISLDDFGVGQSAYSYIRKLPIDSVKIDNDVISKLGRDTNDEKIVYTLIKLFESLNLEVICEGVELREQLDILRNMECKYIQGYYISEPVDKERFNLLFKKEKEN